MITMQLKVTLLKTFLPNKFLTIETCLAKYFQKNEYATVKSYRAKTISRI